ncbi:S24/S26 family peptidase [Sphingobacterium yanglingense]|uniref:Signal peptidase I n=1 Tax=Sphingobacterium yanglingense TaxID=1437280 RepID=A0A4R6WHW7_9SPHI|nr:S24/S26 family peptidase [Sphingobacterium yanglingense]TDQ77997.1 signal peptidase I [Sphingobacterium yanglingense]
MEQTKKKIVCKNDHFLKNVEVALELGKKVKIAVRGNSMNPVLNDGDIVILEKGQQLPIEKGDIILAKYEEKYVLHRVVWISSDFFYLAGDGNKLQVEKVRKDNAIATVGSAFRGELCLPLSFSGSRLQLFKRSVLGACWYLNYSIKKKFL